MRAIRLAVIAAYATFLGGSVALAQAPAFDNSGNGLLRGTHYFREVIYVLADASGNFGRAIAVYGNINYDGAGNYTVTGANVFDSSGRGVAEPFTASGTYTISSSGFGFISSPIANGAVIYGGVANGIFVGSTTENGFNDMIVTAKVATPLFTASDFRGSYRTFMLDPVNDRGAQINMNPDGAGNVGTVSVSGYIATSTVVNQSTPSVRYIFSNGAANISFPGNQFSTAAPLLVGTRFLYFSEDGKFVFGGSPTGWDMIVGIRDGTDPPNFGGLYYQAGIDQNDSGLPSFSSTDTYYGAFNAGGGVTIDHQRLFSPQSTFGASAFDLTFSSTYPTIPADGAYTDPVTNPTTRYIVAPGGAVRVGLGVGPFLSLNVAVRVPPLSGEGVFLNPVGVVNSASNAPFTVGVSRGALITLYGTNLAANTVVAGIPFPTTLDNVQVLINGRRAPIYFVSPGQVSVIVPYATELSLAGIQVVNNGQPSNLVTTYVAVTTPGVFTKPEGGIGPGAVLHADFTLVTEAKPALPGETVQVYLTGLGEVTPAITDGAPGPIEPLAKTTFVILAAVGGAPATVTFAGLAPQLSGLYQVNLTIPATGVAAGLQNLDIAGPDSYATQAKIWIAAAPTAADPLAAPPPSTKARATKRRP